MMVLSCHHFGHKCCPSCHGEWADGYNWPDDVFPPDKGSSECRIFPRETEPICAMLCCGSDPLLRDRDRWAKAAKAARAEERAERYPRVRK